MGFEDKDHDDHENSDHGKALTITLAATMFLVGVVLLLLLLYFYAQHLLKRQQRRRRHDLLYHISNTNRPRIEPTPNSGLDPLIIATLPTTLYKQTEHFRQGQVMECSVCLTTLVEDATIRVLPNCKHVFHVDCVDTWFSSNTTCPVCRTVVAEPTMLHSDDDQLQQQQPTTSAPILVEDVGVSVTSRDADRSELENVGCSGLRIASFSSIVIGRERSRKNQSSDHGSDSNIEDVEKQ